MSFRKILAISFFIAWNAIPYIEKKYQEFYLQQNQCTKPDTDIHAAKSMSPDILLIEQDKQSVQLIDKLMNYNDTTPFKTIAQEFMQLKELHQHYPELHQLMSKNLDSPDTTQFIEELKQIAQQKKLPPAFNQAFQEHSNKINSMGWFEYGTYAFYINKKF